MLQIFIILEYRGGAAGNNAFHCGMDSSFLSFENANLLSAKTQLKPSKRSSLSHL